MAFHTSISPLSINSLFNAIKAGLKPYGMINASMFQGDIDTVIERKASVGL